MNCLLCRSGNIHTIEVVRVRDIRRLYAESLKIDVGYLFPCKTLNFSHCKDCDLKYFDPPVTGDQRFYEALQEHDWYYLEEKEEYHYASSFITESHSVLDIGCGKAAFAGIIKSANYTGLDFSLHAKEIAASRGIRIANETIQEHAEKKNRYDIVCAFQVLEHVADIEGFVRSATDCLQRGGLFILSVPSDESYLSVATNAVTNMPPHHVSRWTDTTLRHIGRLFGLTLVDLSHEALSSLHMMTYTQTVLAARIRRLLGMERRIVDVSLTNMLVTRMAYVPSRLFSLYASRDESRIGHTVTIVLRKQP